MRSGHSLCSNGGGVVLAHRQTRVSRRPFGPSGLTLKVLNLLLYLSREEVFVLKKKHETKKGKVVGILGAILALVAAIGLIRKKVCRAETKEKTGAKSKKKKA